MKGVCIDERGRGELSMVNCQLQMLTEAPE